MIARLISAAMIAAALVAPAAAQDRTGTGQEIKPYEIKRLIIGKTIVIDKEFAEKNGVAEPSPFSVTIPTGEDFLTLLDTKKGGFLKVTFASPEREFLESIQFVDMEVPADLKEKRTPVVAKLMSEKVFANATADLKDAKILAIREAEIGGLGAVEVIGRYTDEKDGLIYLWIVGLPHPVSSRGTYAIATIHFGRRPMTTDEDFRNTLAGRALYSFRYVQ
jgi:hypothetical protein